MKENLHLYGFYFVISEAFWIYNKFFYGGTDAE